MKPLKNVEIAKRIQYDYGILKWIKLTQQEKKLSHVIKTGVH